jgi:hypothetical protein
MELTNEQRNYLLQRLDEITRDKLKAKEKELFGDAGANATTWGQVFAAIKAGEIVLKEGTEDYTRPYLKPEDVEWPAREALNVALQDYKTQLANERKTIMDTVMLAGVAGAVEALTNYASL